MVRPNEAGRWVLGLVSPVVWLSLRVELVSTWEVFVGIGVTGIVGVAARAAVGVAVLEGVGALVQAQDASKTDTASANVPPSRGYLRSVKSTA